MFLVQGQISRVVCDMHALLGAERLRRQELAEAELEKRELLELLRDLQLTRSQQPAEQAARGQHQEDQEMPCWDRARQPAETPLHTSSLSLSSPPNSASNSSPQLGERKGPRSLTLDCIKRRSREVTVI